MYIYIYQHYQKMCTEKFPYSFLFSLQQQMQDGGRFPLNSSDNSHITFVFCQRNLLRTTFTRFSSLDPPDVRKISSLHTIYYRIPTHKSGCVCMLISYCSRWLYNSYLLVINPLLPNGNYSYRIIKISFSKREGIEKKFPMSAASMSR